MHATDLILSLTGALVAALVLGYLTQRIGLSPIVGYLLAGIVIGEHTPGFVADKGLAEQLAEVGVILLMFGVGLQFHWRELLAVRRIALPGAVGQSVAATLLALLATRLFGWEWSAGLVFGLAISVASTVVLVRVLSDSRALHTPTGHIAVGWLVVEDLFTVVVLVLLPALASAGAGSTPAQEGDPLALELAFAALKIGALVAATALAGGSAIPWILERVAATKSRELFILAVLALALGIAVGSAKLFGVSMALGAFLAGMMVGRSEFSGRAAAEALPMRDAFAVLFFVSVGMLFDPRHLIEAPGLVAATLAIVLVGKPAAALGIVWLLGYPPGTGLAVAIALAQIGEFSFLLALRGTELGVLPAAAMDTIVAAAIVSITLNPLLYRSLPAMERGLRGSRLWTRLRARSRARERREDAAAGEGPRRSDSAHRAVIVGYGPVGRTVTRLLAENGIAPTVVEMNLETVRALRSGGIAAVYGDGSRGEILAAAGVERAGSLILTPAQFPGSGEAIRIARELNPGIQVLARSSYLRDQPALLAAGAATVFSDEGEVALALTVRILRGLGATAEQIDREEDRVRAELAAERESNGSARPLRPAAGEDFPPE